MEVDKMAADRAFDGRRSVALALVCALAALVSLVVPRDAGAGGGPLPLAGAAAIRTDTLPGRGVAVIVCHVAAGARALGIPIVVQAGEVAAFLASNPRDYVGACHADGESSATRPAPTAVAVPGPAAVRAGLLAGMGDGVLVVVCGRGDGDLFLTPEAATALARVDAGVTFGSCAASRSGDGRATSGSSGSSQLEAVRPAAVVFDGGEASTSSGSVGCGDRLIVTRVTTTPRVVRTRNATVTTRLVVLDDRGQLVRGATVWLRSVPLDHARASKRGVTGPDGSVRLTVATTKRLPLRAGTRLVLFARATLPGRRLIGCTTGRRLISVRVSRPRS
jgi:hypothetical protein